MAKVDIKFNNPILDQENIEKIANAINENADTLDGIFDEDGKIDASKLNKKLYYHPVTIFSKSGYDSLSISCTIISQNSTKFTSLENFISWCRNNSISYIAPASGCAYSASSEKIMIVAWIDITSAKISIRGHYIDDTNAYLRSLDILNANFDNYNIDDTGVNEIYPN